MENIRKIRLEIDREIKATNDELAERRMNLKNFRDSERVYKALFEARGLSAVNPFLLFVVIRQIFEEARKDRELIDFLRLKSSQKKIGELAGAIDARLDLYAQAKAQGVEIDPEFEKRFKENVYEAIASLDIVKDGKLKEKDSELKRVVEKLEKEIKREIRDIRKEESCHHATYEEA